MDNEELNMKIEKSKDKNIENNTIEKQKGFLENNLGQIINGGIELGLRAILPDVIEDEIIEIKNNIITDGFKSGIKSAVDGAIDLGKSVLGIFTGKFENMSQVKNAIKNGGIIDSISDVLDFGIKKAKENNLINNTTASLIKNGKNTILNTINTNIENSLTSQMESVEKIDKYISNWESYYKEQDFFNMEKQFNKIENELIKIMPLEEVIKKARQVENIHNLIKNNGKNFNLSNEEIELSKKLA